MKASVKSENFVAAREVLGQICHIIQVRVIIIVFI